VVGCSDILGLINREWWAFDSVPDDMIEVAADLAGRGW
jgi:hypothetical protein